MKFAIFYVWFAAQLSWGEGEQVLSISCILLHYNETQVTVLLRTVTDQATLSLAPALPRERVVALSEKTQITH